MSGSHQKPKKNHRVRSNSDTDGGAPIWDVSEDVPGYVEPKSPVEGDTRKRRWSLGDHLQSLRDVDGLHTPTLVRHGSHVFGETQVDAAPKGQVDDSSASGNGATRRRSWVPDWKGMSFSNLMSRKSQRFPESKSNDDATKQGMRTSKSNKSKHRPHSAGGIKGPVSTANQLQKLREQDGLDSPTILRHHDFSDGQAASSCGTSDDSSLQATPSVIKQKGVTLKGVTGSKIATRRQQQALWQSKSSPALQPPPTSMSNRLLDIQETYGLHSPTITRQVNDVFPDSSPPDSPLTMGRISVQTESSISIGSKKEQRASIMRGWRGDVGDVRQLMKVDKSQDVEAIAARVSQNASQYCNDEPNDNDNLPKGKLRHNSSYRTYVAPQQVVSRKKKDSFFFSAPGSSYD
eukprot:gnl/MRDRNA2_/MRDRNA2_67283_c0_seq1.p1 gnl/MRDRNA2_/MRDRNA2_67283_c0~~gnl/MRDRNA2_/MRDRNA2_67283_c0_seq1.p1  ORF type:complete len:404 (+),score=58.10 gnl/MRDRNA2_/MRDRNA2_67283_c0_seq1:64-1275(+)